MKNLIDYTTLLSVLERLETEYEENIQKAYNHMNEPEAFIKHPNWSKGALEVLERVKEALLNRVVKEGKSKKGGIHDISDVYRPDYKLKPESPERLISEKEITKAVVCAFLIESMIAPNVGRRIMGRIFADLKMKEAEEFGKLLENEMKIDPDWGIGWATKLISGDEQIVMVDTGDEDAPLVDVNFFNEA